MLTQDQRKSTRTWSEGYGFNIPDSYLSPINYNVNYTRNYEKQLPEGFTLGSLRPEHADIIIKEWVYADKRPKEEYEDMVRGVRIQYTEGGGLLSCFALG